MADISKIKLPDGVTYNIKDTITEIGGRNLLLKTNQGKTNWQCTSGNGAVTADAYEEGVRFTVTTQATNWMCFLYYVDDNLKSMLSKAGGTFTLSMDIRSSVDFDVYTAWSVRQSNFQTPLIDAFQPSIVSFTANQWKHYEMVGTTTGNQTQNEVSIYFNKCLPVGTYDIKNIKLEKGSKATDWTPAPEDQIAGSGTSGCIAKFNGTNTVTDGPAFGSSITNFLAENGQWRTPTDNKVRQNYIEDTIEKSYMLLLGEHDATYSEYSTTETTGTKKAIGLNYCIKDGYTRTLKISATNGSQTQSVELRPFGSSKIPTLQVSNSITAGSIYSEGSISSDSNIGCDGTLSAKFVNCDSIFANSVTLPHQYSEIEQIVGYWIDGSPVYEITKYDLSSGSGITVAALGTANLMDWTTPIQPISFKGFRYAPTGSSRFYTCWEHMGGQWQASSNKLQCYNSANHARNINGFTMQYIKV